MDPSKTPIPNLTSHLPTYLPQIPQPREQDHKHPMDQKPLRQGPLGLVLLHMRPLAQSLTQEVTVHASILPSAPKGPLGPNPAP